MKKHETLELKQKQLLATAALVCALQRLSFGGLVKDTSCSLHDSSNRPSELRLCVLAALQSPLHVYYCIASCLLLDGSR